MGRARKNGIILIPNNPFAILKPTLPLTGQIVLFLFSYIRPSLLSSPYLYIYASYMCNLLSYIRASYMCNSLLLYIHTTHNPQFHIPSIISPIFSLISRWAIVFSLICAIHCSYTHTQHHISSSLLYLQHLYSLYPSLLYRTSIFSLLI